MARKVSGIAFRKSGDVGHVVLHALVYLTDNKTLSKTPTHTPGFYINLLESQIAGSRYPIDVRLRT